MASKTKADLQAEILGLKKTVEILDALIEDQKKEIAVLKRVNARGAGRKSKITKAIVDQVRDLYQYAPYAEIARIVGLSIGTVHKIIHSDIN